MTCLRCSNETTRALCDLCTTRTATDLHRLACNYLDSEDTSLTPIPPPVGHGAFASKPPASVAWLSWRQGADITPVLLGWADDWARLYQLTGRIPQDIPGLCGWLRNHLARAAMDHPAILEFVDEIHDLARRSARYAGRSNPPRAKILCPAIHDDDTECQAAIWIDSHTEPDTPIKCRTCGATWTRARLEYIAMHTAGEQAWVDAEAAARYAGVAERTIRSWGQQGKVRRQGGLYCLPDLRRERDTA